MFSKIPLRSLVTGLGLALLATACAPERATAPAAPAPSAGLLSSVTGLVSGSLTAVPVITRSTPLAQDISVTQVIGPAGGTISIPGAGLVATFAPGAVAAPTTITATALAGNQVAYNFEPHGIQFSAPVTVTQDLTVTTIANNPTALSNISAGYFPDGQSDFLSNGTALVSEILPVKTVIGTVTGVLGSLLGVKVETGTFVIRHFSGYLLCGA